jgi:hypothetical protein
MAGARLSRSLAASTNPIPGGTEMHSQLNYAAAKLEIADHQRRAEREISWGQPAKPARRARRNPLARLLNLRRTTPVVELAAASHDAC